MIKDIQPRNFLLRLLPPNELDEILNMSEFVHLDVHEVVLEPSKPIDFVYFIETGVISVVSETKNRKMVEIANVGNEGLIGVPIVLGVDNIPEKAFCQIEGSAVRIPAKCFREMLRRSPSLRANCERYVATIMNQIACNSSCNWIHSVQERCSRWLLLAHDRVDGDDFLLTQEFLAMMLGITRSGVNVAAGRLVSAKLITYVRGKITILDRGGLEGSACECYRSMRDYFDKTFDSSRNGFLSDSQQTDAEDI